MTTDLPIIDLARLTRGDAGALSAVAAGEYWVTPSNYINLVNNVRSSGGKSDYWGANPVAVILGEVAINPAAPHPKAAFLAANFLLSKEGQTAVARLGRLPVRADVPPVPADAITKLGDVKVLPLEYKRVLAARHQGGAASQKAAG